MDSEPEKLIELAAGHYLLIFLAALALVVFRKVIENIAMGFLWKSGRDLDGIYYISGRKARLVRINLTNTTFYMEDRKTTMVVPNEQLKELTIEEILPTGPLDIDDPNPKPKTK